ncbi:venom metalloproteinase 2-like [Leptopilina boulardi]|uniref:venom metalloproteinase 2-like n=1 Tax=Leptopilina boulardi TaxID=63433 RepID=UPI0021F52C09|nr:venom metalloproteinase 2-like [Leptopilina boulardi]
MMLFVTLFCAFLVPFTQSWKFHEDMTKDEIKEIFQTTPEAVPEYEVVKVKHKIHKRATTILRARIFNQEKTLYLEPVEGLLIGEHTKVWKAKSTFNGLDYTEVPDAMKNIGQLYQDVKNDAAITVKTDEEGNKEFDGIFGRFFGIKPIPRRHRFRRNVSNNSDVNYLNLPDHIVFKIAEPSLNITKLFSSKKYDNEEIVSQNINKRTKRSAPNVVYPEILVFIDQKLFNVFNRNVTKAVGYIASLFNGIDLRYRAIERPKIRLNVAGIVLIDGFSLFLKTYIRERHLSVDESLDDIAKFLVEEKQFTFKKDYDIALYITGMDLEVKNEDGTYEKDVAGIAYFQGACRKDFRGVRSLGLIEDDGSFNGVINGAHELAHVMGAEHDNMKEGPEACNWDKGYIMSYDGKDVNKLRFSPCSQEELRSFINDEKRNCLYNSPPVDKPLPKILPGTYLSLDDQCMAMSNTKSCGEQRNVCVALFCKHPDLTKRGVCISKNPAAEGSTCDDNKICLNGECVSKTSSIVPGVISYY